MMLFIYGWLLNCCAHFINHNNAVFTAIFSYRCSCLPANQPNDASAGAGLFLNNVMLYQFIAVVQMPLKLQMDY